LARCILGGAVSLSVGLCAAAVSVILGVTWGSLAAMAGGRIDALMMRVVDVLYGLPYILLVILLKLGLEGLIGEHRVREHDVWELVVLLLAIASVSWLTMARVIRGQVLSLLSQPFVEAARAMGATPLRIWRVHLLPNLVAPIVVYATLIVPQAILQESFLSFLGIGIQPPLPSWGNLAAEGLSSVNTVERFWWMLVFPCGWLTATLLALNFLGEGLRDAFDPRTEG
jgi:oligopeptide transport system permease protein